MGRLTPARGAGSSTSRGGAPWRRPAAGACAALLALGWLGESSCAHAVEPTALAGPESPAESAAAVAPAPSSLVLEPGEMRSLPVTEVTRVAIGNPEVMDITVVSSNELLLQGKAIGTTSLILWDQAGQHTVSVQVVDHASAALEAQMNRLLAQLNLPTVRVNREDTKLFLVGEVSRQEALDRLEQMLSAFPGVTNLVVVPPPAPEAAAPSPPMVQLSVQVIEISRTDLERLGIKWSGSMSLTEPAATDLTLRDSLVHFGTSLSRTSVTAALNALIEQKRARLLAEPKLVTASGKEASSFVGLEVPIVTATSFGTTTAVSSTNIEFRQTGVVLTMTPIVHPDTEKITTAIQAEVSSIDNSVALNVPVGTQTVAVPGFSVRKAQTEVTTDSGETIMIAGLLQLEDTRSTSQVPGLGGLPVVGRLFRSPDDQSSRRELVITVTPELLGEAMDDKDVAVDQALAGTDRAEPARTPTLGYALQVQDRIAKSLRYPQEEQQWGKSGTVKLRLRLFRDGTLDQALVAQSSGSEALDQEAVRAAQSQAPYPPFPSDLPQQELWLELPVLFRP